MNVEGAERGNRRSPVSRVMEWVRTTKASYAGYSL
jgi:hypothetical protein